MLTMSGRDQPVSAVAKILSIRSISDRVFLARVLGSEPVDFLPGQYIALQRQGPREPQHYFSIASPPSPQVPNEFELCLGRGTSGFGLTVSQGETFQLVGPLGEGIRPRKESSSVLLVATGTGAALLRSGILHRLWGARRVIAIVGQRTEADLLFKSEFSQALGLEYRPVLSQPTPSWSGLRGHVQAAVEQVLCDERLDPMDAVVCGQKEMVDDVVQRLLRAGLSEQGIFAQGY
jgi:NAD(P)H-flavin reductase